MAERYPAWVEGPTTWTRRSVLVGALAMGVVLVWQRVGATAWWRAGLRAEQGVRLLRALG